MTLRDVEPAVIRVVDVPTESTLPELHDLLQVAIGWTDSHLHQFVAGDRRYGVPDEDDLLDMRDETGALLTNLPATFTYDYDFGDNWQHDIEVLGSGEREPGLRYGEGACPPEDCGGPSGYAEFLAALADPAHPDHHHLRTWAGTFGDFDQDATALLVRQALGAVPESARLVLSLAEGGVKLTPAGRLPRAFVREVQAARPGWALLNRPASLEEDLPPLATLHEVLRHVRLLRLSRGVLTPTHAARDDLQILRRLRSWFPAGEFETIAAEWTVAMLASRGPQRMTELAPAVFDQVGRGWAMDGRPLTASDVQQLISGHQHLWTALDLVQAEPPGLGFNLVYRTGPSALTLLPSATHLAHLMTRHRADEGAATEAAEDE